MIDLMKVLCAFAWMAVVAAVSSSWGATGRPVFYPLCREVCPDGAFCQPTGNHCLCIPAPGAPGITCVKSYQRCHVMECDSYTCPGDSAVCVCIRGDHEEPCEVYEP